MSQDFLMHYGTPGMKWGVRKAKKKAFIGDSKDPRKQELYRKLVAAEKKRDAAKIERSKSVLGRWGYGKTAKAYTQAERERNDAADAYVRSLNKREFDRLVRRTEVIRR